jgi:hypothetical protein
MMDTESFDPQDYSSNKFAPGLGGVGKLFQIYLISIYYFIFLRLKNKIILYF